MSLNSIVRFIGLLDNLPEEIRLGHSEFLDVANALANDSAAAGGPRRLFSFADHDGGNFALRGIPIRCQDHRECLAAFTIEENIAMIVIGRPE